jgi:hypothetical protein
MDEIKPIGQEPAGARQGQQMQQAPPPPQSAPPPPEIKQNLQAALSQVDTSSLSPQAMTALEDIQGKTGQEG